MATIRLTSLWCLTSLVSCAHTSCHQHPVTAASFGDAVCSQDPDKPADFSLISQRNTRNWPPCEDPRIYNHDGSQPSLNAFQVPTHHAEHGHEGAGKWWLNRFLKRIGCRGQKPLHSQRLFNPKESDPLRNNIRLLLLLILNIHKK